MTRRFGYRSFKLGFASLALGLAGLASPAEAAGDLLVAPTRIVLEGRRGAEVILNNVGSETATYRITLELRHMTADGNFEDIDPANANDREKTALAMISYAPRRVVLPPNQPQSIRIGIRAPEGLPDGEYRAHLLFRAIPVARSVTAPAEPAQGIRVTLTPIYGVTIPVIVRQGRLTATAGLANPHIVSTPQGDVLLVTLSRSGTKSTYGQIRVLKPGVAEPLVEVRGVAVYAENGERTVALPLDPGDAAKLRGPVIIQYIDESDARTGTLAEFKGEVR